MTLKFTQYLRPDGRKVEVVTDCPKGLEKQALELIDKGYFFELECLTTGHASMTVEHKDYDEPVAIEVCANDPEKVRSALSSMLTKAHQRIQN